MSDPFGDMLRIVPHCEAARCRQNGTVHIELTHPKRPVQRADLCPKHAPVIVKAAEAEGYAVRIR